MSNEMDDINALSEEAFVDRFGFLFEHSPWVVEEASVHRPFATRQDMYGALMEALYDAYGEDYGHLAILRAHPKLADKAAIDAGLTPESAAEQASAGLDRLTPDEFDEFQSLNTAYEKKFGFPFIICVRMAGGKSEILASMRWRLLNNKPDNELQAALDEVAKIVKLRLEDALA